MKINQQVKILVSEPWDFTSPEGNNIFTGVVIDSTNSVFGETYLIKINKPFVMNGLSINYIVVIYRNKDKDSRNLNIAYIPDDVVDQFRKLEEIKDKLKFIIIGSLD